MRRNERNTGKKWERNEKEMEEKRRESERETRENWGRNEEQIEEKRGERAEK